MPAPTAFLIFAHQPSCTVEGSRLHNAAVGPRHSSVSCISRQHVHLGEPAAGKHPSTGPNALQVRAAAVPGRRWQIWSTSSVLHRRRNGLCRLGQQARQRSACQAPAAGDATAEDAQERRHLAEPGGQERHGESAQSRSLAVARNPTTSCQHTAAAASSS